MKETNIFVGQTTPGFLTAIYVVFTEARSRTQAVTPTGSHRLLDNLSNSAGKPLRLRHWISLTSAIFFSVLKGSH